MYFLREQLKEKDSWLKNLIFTKSATESKKFYNHDDNELKLSISKILEDVLSQNNLFKVLGDRNKFVKQWYRIG